MLSIMNDFPSKPVVRYKRIDKFIWVIWHIFYQGSFYYFDMIYPKKVTYPASLLLKNGSSTNSKSQFFVHLLFKMRLQFQCHFHEYEQIKFIICHILSSCCADNMNCGSWIFFSSLLSLNSIKCQKKMDEKMLLNQKNSSCCFVSKD